MCQTVIIENSQFEEIETPNQLLKVVPNLRLIKNEMYGVIDYDNCLCQIELELTFHNANIPYTVDCMEYRINLN